MTKTPWQLYDKNMAMAELTDISEAVAETAEKLASLQKLQVSAIINAKTAGWANAEIAKVVGVSKQRIFQLLLK